MMNDFKDEKKDDGAGDDAPAGEATPGPDAEAAAAEPAVEDRATTLQRELDECKSRALRAVADYQNAVRRTQQSVAEAREQQLFEVGKALINVLDHFDRALEVDVNKVTAQSLLQGVQI